MGRMLSKKLYDAGKGRLVHWCPACDMQHMLWTEECNQLQARWTFDGNAESPTFSPSVNIDLGVNRVTQRPRRCHYFVVEGMIQYLGDCSHGMAGKTVPLPDYPSEETQLDNLSDY